MRQCTWAGLTITITVKCFTARTLRPWRLHYSYNKPQSSNNQCVSVLIYCTRERAFVTVSQVLQLSATIADVQTMVTNHSSLLVLMLCFCYLLRFIIHEFKLFCVLLQIFPFFANVFQVTAAKRYHTASRLSLTNRKKWWMARYHLASTLP